MLRFLEAIENDGEDYDLYNYGEDATAESVLESVWGKGDFEMLQDVSASAIGDLVAAVELFNEINGTTYDSIRTPTETVIFNSNQAKLTSNKNPTDDPDIRYKVSAGDVGAGKKNSVDSFTYAEDNGITKDLERGGKMTTEEFEKELRKMQKAGNRITEEQIQRMIQNHIKGKNGEIDPKRFMRRQGKQ